MIVLFFLLHIYLKNFDVWMAHIMFLIRPSAKLSFQVLLLLGSVVLEFHLIWLISPLSRKNPVSLFKNLIYICSMRR